MNLVFLFLKLLLTLVTLVILVTPLSFCFFNNLDKSLKPLDNISVILLLDLLYSSFKRFICIKLSSRFDLGASFKFLVVSAESANLLKFLNISLLRLLNSFNIDLLFLSIASEIPLFISDTDVLSNLTLFCCDIWMLLYIIYHIMFWISDII